MSERGVARVNGHRLAYEVTDFVDPWLEAKETQVWVHGFMGRQEVFCRQVPAFCRQFRVVTYDQRGFGASSAPKRGSYGIEDYVGDLGAFVDHLGLKKFHLVGHSFGGMVAQGFALKHQRRLQSLVLIATRGTSAPEHPEQRRVIDGVIKAGGMRGFADAFAAAYADPSEPEISAWNLEMTARTNPHVVMANAEGKTPFNFLPRLKRLKVPTLVLNSKTDKLIAETDARALAKAIPTADLVWYEGSHGAPLKKPDAITDPMQAFYARIQAGSH